MRIRLRTGLLLGGTLLSSLLVLGPAAAVVAANGQVCMGIVIDDAGYNGNGSAVQAANVGPGSSDLQALQAAGDTVYQNDSGLVCALDDGSGEVPANGVQNCTATSGSDYDYWSYWEGDPYTDTWTYANIGPAEHTVSSGQTYVEGWRFQDPGPDNSTAPKPSVTPAAAFAQACPGVQPVPSGGAGGGGSSAGGSSGGGSGGSGAGTSPGTSSPSAAVTTTTAASGAVSSPPRTANGDPAGSGGPTTTTRPGADAPSPPSGTHSTSTTTTAGRGAQHGNGNGNGNGKATLALARPRGTSGGGDPALPIVIVAAVIVLLGGLAWWRWRRRPLEE